MHRWKYFNKRNHEYKKVLLNYYYYYHYVFCVCCFFFVFFNCRIFVLEGGCVFRILYIFCSFVFINTTVHVRTRLFFLCEVSRNELFLD